MSKGRDRRVYDFFVYCPLNNDAENDSPISKKYIEKFSCFTL